MFLLKPLGLASMRVFDDIGAKELQIQTGRAHYSQMLSQEQAPTQEYLRLFEDAMHAQGERFARDTLILAKMIRSLRRGQITLVSLARAGTPIAVLLQRRLKAMGADVKHFSISIVRDRGIDENALKHIVTKEGRTAASVIFIDGWTAKGMIGGELKKAVRHWNRRHPQWAMSDALCVVSDIGGTADVSATEDDYLMPSGILNSVISGLVSRSILNDEIGPDDFHGCIYYDSLEHEDRSVEFVDRIDAIASSLVVLRSVAGKPDPSRFQEMVIDLWAIQKEYGVSDINRIKPGIAEATRVLLRRVPDLVLVRDLRDLEVAHLLLLAKEKGVEVIERPAMRFRAISLIKDVMR